MKSVLNWLPQMVLAAGLWTSVNGILHSIFVLTGEHGKQYNRELLRLLTDGLLLTSFGVVLLLCFRGLQAGDTKVFWIAIAICAATVIYCLMIWPFLRSVATLAIHTLTLVWLLLAIFTR